MLTEIQISVGEFWSWLLQSTGFLKVNYTPWKYIDAWIF